MMNDVDSCVCLYSEKISFHKHNSGISIDGEQEEDELHGLVLLKKSGKVRALEDSILGMIIVMNIILY